MDSFIAVIVVIEVVTRVSQNLAKSFKKEHFITAKFTATAIIQAKIFAFIFLEVVHCLMLLLFCLATIFMIHLLIFVFHSLIVVDLGCECSLRFVNATADLKLFAVDDFIEITTVIIIHLIKHSNSMDAGFMHNRNYIFLDSYSARADYNLNAC